MNCGIEVSDWYCSVWSLIKWWFPYWIGFTLGYWWRVFWVKKVDKKCQN